MRAAIIATVLCLSLIRSCFAQTTPGPTSRVETRIAPQGLCQALAKFAEARHIQVLYLTSALKGLRTSGASGELTADETLTRLLSGTALKYRYVDANAISIIAGSRHADPVRGASVGGPSKPRSHTTDDGNAATARKHSDPPEVPRRPRKRPATKNNPPALQEVIVTGTHINGGPPPSAPIITITRQDIEDSGYQSVEQVMSSLPENFASVGSGQTFDVASQSSASNDANGAAIDLNGLGFDSTLVLVNGHRLAPSGAAGAFTDISVIPLSAIERIEVMTEGASAIYGSDAIGGVVNFILKSHQRGAETSVEYGSVTHGGLMDYRVSQSAGGGWPGGSGLISYEYHKQTPLSSEDRTFSNLAPHYEPTDLLPGLVQNEIYGTATQSLDANTTLEGDVLYEHRDAHSSLMDTEPLTIASASQQFSGGVEISHRAAGGLATTARLTYGENDATSGDLLATDHDASKLVSISAGVTGRLFHIPSGQIKWAFGTEARREAFSIHESGLYASTVLPIDRSRMVYALYGEGRIPLWPGRRPGAHAAASLDLAARYEHYTDFGSTLDPMGGLAWEPTRWFRVRGTAGWSFRAPNFDELYGAQDALLVNSPVPNQAATSLVLFRTGSNPALKPEKSMEWTAGFDLLPGDSRLTASVTYFHIHFRDRIAAPNIPLLTALDQGSTYQSFIQPTPSVGQLTSLAGSAAQFTNVTAIPGYGPPGMVSDAIAIADDRLQNISALNVDGVDANVRRHGRLSRLTYSLGMEGSYLLRYEEVYLPGTAPLSLLNTFENPVNLRAKLTAGLGFHGLSLHGALNYTSHYHNTSGQLPYAIASWTTVNLGIAYQVPAWSYFSESRIQLSCTNCLNRLPPYTGTGGYVFAFDPLNASAMGRFASLEMQARW
ncbi:MAG: TonB-dependent receptor [Proteobacteria bacterium]|nr:TonB-dependent receptor [Pseudomonadota bacterium]